MTCVGSAADEPHQKYLDRLRSKREVARAFLRRLNDRKTHLVEEQRKLLQVQAALKKEQELERIQKAQKDR